MTSTTFVADALRHAAKLRPAHVAVVDGTRSVTYAELLRRTRRLANALRGGLGLSAQERLGLLAPNRLECVELFFAAAAAGCACVPINPRLSEREVAEIAVDAELRALFVDPTLDAYIAAVKRTEFDGPIVSFGRPGQAGDHEYEELLRSASAAPAEDRFRRASDTVLQVYTSGTTGAPKGVMLSHRNLLANSWTNRVEASVVPSDRYLSSAPMAHVAAASRMLTLAHAGATHVIERGFDPDRVVAAIAEGRADSTFAVPAMLRELLESARVAGPLEGKLRLIAYGGAPMPVDLLEQAIGTFACDFQQGYGLTEASPILTILPPDDHRPNACGKYSRRLGSVGREAVGVHVRVVDPNDHKVDPGDVGEIVARGQNVMEGYWRQPEETAAALRAGWLRTGDLARVDEDGYIYLVDRSKDMLVSGGLNVYPREVEQQLERHPWVAEAAVVGIPDERWGEVPVAYLVIRDRPATGAAVDAVMEHFLKGRLARYKTPKRYEILPMLPRSSAGKVLKRELRDRASRAEDWSSAAPG